jgi:hypothetical protein
LAQASALLQNRTMLFETEQLTNKTKPAVLAGRKKIPLKEAPCQPCGPGWRQLKLLLSRPGKEGIAQFLAGRFAHFSRFFWPFIPFIRSFTPSYFQFSLLPYTFVTFPLPENSRTT